MSLQFVVKPYALDAVGPAFFRWVWRYGIAAVLTYFLAGFFNYQTVQLIVALCSVVLLASFLTVKHAIIKVHITKYSFYDTHVVEEFGLIIKKRNSMPYKQINKLVNEAGLWNRLTGASDIVLQSAHHHDLRLRSIKDADAVEHKIYALLRKSHKTESGEADISEVKKRK